MDKPLTERTAREPSAVSLLRISRDRAGTLELAGRSWQEDGSLSARYWSEALKEKKDSSGVFYCWRGERPLDPNAPQWKARGRFGWSRPSARPGTSRLVRTRIQD